LKKGDRVGEKSVAIRSPILLNALRAVVKYSSSAPSGDEDSLKDGIFPFPYMDLYHYKEDLLEYQKGHPARLNHTDEYNAQCDRHIDILIDYLYSQEDVRLTEAEERWAKKVPTTTFGSFWLLMKSGSDVYVEENGCHNAYVVESISGGPSRDGKVKPYKIFMWQLKYNGDKISRKSRKIFVPIFDGEREITSLPLYPVKFHRERPGEKPLKDRLIDRGKKYVSLSARTAFQQYSGKGLENGFKKVCLRDLLLGSHPRTDSLSV
jgi:hypothetical protein